MKTCIFISDIHLNVYDPRYPHDYTWLSNDQKQLLVGFLNSLRPNQVETLAILGDLFDNWIWPVDAPPPSIEQIAAANQDVFDALRGLRQLGINVVYVRGNHDMAVSLSDLRAIFPSGPSGLAAFQFCEAGVYQDASIHGEHSHAYCMFNAPDPQRPDKLPIGYYISRVIATHSAHTGEHPRELSEFVQDALIDVRDAVDIVVDVTIAERVFDAVLTYADIPGSSSIVMPGGVSLTVAQIKQAFDNLWSRWAGPNSRLKALLADCTVLDPVARQIFNTERSTNVVVLGHSHLAQLRRYSDTVYANSGSWCRSKGAGDFVEIIREESAHNLTVQRWKWTGRETDKVKVDEARIPTG